MIKKILNNILLLFVLSGSVKAAFIERPVICPNIVLTTSDYGCITNDFGQIVPSLLVVTTYEGDCYIDSVFVYNANTGEVYANIWLGDNLSGSGQYFYNFLPGSSLFISVLLSDGTNSQTFAYMPSSCAGCTDVAACNYNPYSSFSDASCTYPGCTNPSASNYNGLAGCDNGSCIYGNYFGCMSYTACNYDPYADVDDGSCIYPGCTNTAAVNFDYYAGCDDGSCLYDFNYGCMDYLACNYNQYAIYPELCSYPGCNDISAINYQSWAGCDDGSCYYDYTYGCTDYYACNYNPYAFYDDGLCSYSGCTDHDALNYSPVAGCDDGSCYYEGLYGCLDFYACNYNPVAYYDDNSCTYQGCTDYSAINYNPSAGCEDGSCFYEGVLGCTDSYACNWNTDATIDDGSCTYPGCTDAFALNYNSFAGCDDGSCYYSYIYGCSNSYACNWNPNANIDDGSCTYPGCTDPNATNYNYYAGCNDGSCLYNTYYGCTNLDACNYDQEANIDDGSCIYPGCTDPVALNYDFSAGCSDYSCVYNTYCGNPQLLFTEGPCVANDNGTGLEVTLTFDFDGECSVASVTVNGQVIDVQGYYFIANSQIPVVINPFTATTWSYTLGNGVSSSTYTYTTGSCAEYYGCTDINACNFSTDATIEDGSCTYPGCSDPSAINFDINAGCSDNSCYYSYDYGCMDFSACNYNPYAIYSDYCSYPGCTQLDAYNYDWSAGCDDGSCVYAGCTDINACNYLDYATIDLGTCSYPGCNDPTAVNYDATAGCSDYSCSYSGGCANPTLIIEEGQCISTGNSFGPQLILTFAYSGSCSVSSITLNDQTFDVSDNNYTAYSQETVVLPPNFISTWSYTLGNGIASPVYNFTTSNCNPVFGCTDAEACNYDSQSNVNNGSCTYPGCTDPMAINYSSLAGCDNGSCYYSEIYGCTDSYACNWNPNATIDNSTCTYPGCTDPFALNYNSLAGCDNGSCYYNEIYGCTDSYACNWNPNATIDNSTCTYPGCTDPLALNYNSFAGCDNGSCYYSEIYGCTDSYACNWNPDATIYDGSCTYPGCTDPSAANYNYYAGCDDGSCYYIQQYGCTDWEACNYDAYADVDDSSCVYPGCTDPNAMNYDMSAGCADYSCVYAGTCGNPQLLFEEGLCVAGDNGTGVEVNVTFAYEGECTIASVTFNGQEFDVSGEYITANTQIPIVVNPFSTMVLSYTLGNGVSSETYTYSVGGCSEYYGCMDINACNFEDMVTIDNGSCTYPGCNSPSAINYDSLAGCFDNSCYYSYDYGCTDMLACNYNPSAIYNDYCSYPGCTNYMASNYDFNAGCDDGSCIYLGCTDMSACNYVNYATFDNGTCTFPGCNDPAASNFNPNAGCSDLSCTYAGGCSNPTLILQDGGCVYNQNTFGTQVYVTFAFEGTCSVASITVNGQVIDVTEDNYTANSQDSVILPPNLSTVWTYTLGNGLVSQPYTFTSGDCLPIFGCTDPQACNFDSQSNIDNESCLYPGCLDTNSCNYNPLAGCQDLSTCTYPGTPCDDNNVNTQNDVLNESCNCVACAFSAPEIIGDVSVAPGTNQVYSISAVAGVNYIWTASGGSIISGQGTNSVSINWSSAGNYTLTISIVALDGTCIQTDMMSVLVIGVSETETSGVRLFPNPASEVLNINYELAKPDRIEIMNLLGEQLYSGTFKSQLDVSRFANGMYVLRIWRNGVAETRRFEVQH